MKNSLRRRMGTEEGRVLVPVLAMLVVGGLVLAPLLGMTGAGLASGEVYERKASELYAADAGVEDAIWKLQNPDVSDLPHKGCDKPWDAPYVYPKDGDPPFVLNGKNVVVTIEYLSGGIFRITSTASENGSSTTVLSYVQADYEGGIPYDEKYADGSSVGSISGNLTHYGEGDLTVTGSIEGEAVVYVEGTLTVDGNIENFAQVYVGGDLILTGTVRRGPNTTGNIEGDVIICVARNVTINGNIEEDVQMYILGNLTLTNEGEDSENRGKIEDEAQVCVEGEIKLIKTQDDCIVCAGETLEATGGIEGGDIYAPEFTNHSLHPSTCPMCCEECDICCACPLVFTGGGAGSWGGWRVTTYLINPEQ